jgi:hypothetical protein
MHTIIVIGLVSEGIVEPTQSGLLCRAAPNLAKPTAPCSHSASASPPLTRIRFWNPEGNFSAFGDTQENITFCPVAWASPSHWIYRKDEARRISQRQSVLAYNGQARCVCCLDLYDGEICSNAEYEFIAIGRRHCKE